MTDLMTPHPKSGISMNEDNSSPPPEESEQSFLLSYTTMVVSLLALTLAMAGSVKIALALFQTGFDQSKVGLLQAQLIALALAYFFSWIMAIVSMHVYANIALPSFLKIYAWGTLVGISLLYLKIIFKLYLQPVDTFKFVLYMLMMAAGLAVLIGLHLIIEGHDLRMFSIPLLALSMLQLGMIVYRYVYAVNTNPAFLWWDLLFFSVMLLTSGLMLAHLGILNSLRRGLDNLFRSKPATAKDKGSAESEQDSRDY
jgi:hypothetical protein